MNVGDQALYFSPVNETFTPCEVVDLWDDHHVDVKIGSGYKIRIPIHMKELPRPFLDLRSQRIPLPFVVYETDS